MHPGYADRCEFPKCENLDCIICGSGGLRSRSPLIIVLKKRSKTTWLQLACVAASLLQERLSGADVLPRACPSFGLEISLPLAVSLPLRATLQSQGKFNLSPLASLALSPKKIRC